MLILTPKNVIILPFSVISAALGILKHTVKIASDPVNFSYEQWCENDPVELSNNQQRIQNNQALAAQNAQRAQFLTAQSQFNQCMSRYQQDNTDVAAIKYIAQAYENGNGVQQDTQQSIQFYKEAAQLDDIDSIKYLANAYGEGIIVQTDHTRSFDYYKKAAKLGDIDAMYEVGKCYNDGFGTTKV